MTDTQWIPIVLSILAGVGGLVFALMRLQHAIGLQFMQTRMESETRTSGTHKRIEAMTEAIDRTYVRKDLHEAHIDRLDGELAHLRTQIGCPASEKD